MGHWTETSQWIICLRKPAGSELHVYGANAGWNTEFKTEIMRIHTKEKNNYGC